MTKETIPAGAKYKIEVEDENGEIKVGYLKKLSRTALETALGYMMPIGGTPKIITAGEIILNACWVGGDEEIRKNEDLLVEACMQAVQLVERKEASLKKL